MRCASPTAPPTTSRLEYGAAISDAYTVLRKKLMPAPSGSTPMAILMCGCHGAVCAPRNRRASVRHAEDADGCDALSDEAVAQCRDRNGAERTQLQSHACAEHRRSSHCWQPCGREARAVDSMATPTAAHVARRRKEVASRRRTAKILRNRRVGVSHCWSRAVSECGAAFLHCLDPARSYRTAPGILQRGRSKGAPDLE